MKTRENYTRILDFFSYNKKHQELDDLKDEFVSLVSHELRTPVCLVSGYLRAAVDQLGNDVSPEVRGYLQIADKNVARLSRTVQELTDFSRAQKPLWSEYPDPTLLGEALDQVQLIFAPFISSKQLKLSVNLPEDIYHLKYDRECMLIIFRNLLSNSVKFTPDGGKIEVRGSDKIQQDGVEISISDSSSPIPSKLQKKLFEDFRQLENHLTRRYEGMGLGLHVARRVARRLGGDIQFKAKSEGNTFVVRLPISSDKSQFGNLGLH